MTAREKNLSIAVGAIFVLMLNFFLIQFFVRHQRQLREDFQTRAAELQAKKMLFDERELWEKRSAWVVANQPKLINEVRAGGDLLDQVKEVAKKANVLLESPAIGTPEKRPQCISVSVIFETRSNWETLCVFLREMQGQDRFLVFENANLQVDKADKTQMHGIFRVAKWFAPR